MIGGMVGLNGFKSSGKDTVGAYLVEEHGFVRYSFADLLKESAAALFNITPEEWDEYKNDESVEVVLRRGQKHIDRQTARSFLQRYGTEAHRDVFGGSFWIDAVMEQINIAYGGFKVVRGKRVPARGFNIVFTDARFENELRAIRSHGGKNIRILRPGLDGEDQHVSEAAAPDELIDIELVNDGSIEDLYTLIDDVVVQL